MVYENNLPPVGKGITVLFDINDSIKTLVCNMLEKESVEDKYLYLVGVDTLQFGLYYRDVCKECEDINQLFYSCGDINNGIVCPKVMFLFDNMNSCKNFKDFIKQRAVIRKDFFYLFKSVFEHEFTNHFIRITRKFFQTVSNIFPSIYT